MYLLLTFLFASLAVVNAGDNLSTLITEVFGENPDSLRQEHIEDDCTCVPYYLCENNTVVTNGVGVIDIRTGDSHCSNYLDVCCNSPLDHKPITEKPTSTWGGGEDVSRVDFKGCGIRNEQGVGFRIIGDEDGEAQYGEFPWMVAVLKEEVSSDAEGELLNIYQCGGSLINAKIVLTSAHCVSSPDIRYKIRAGEWDTQTNNELYEHQDRFVKSVVIHPEYYPGALYNDVALLFLEEPVLAADNIGYICLPLQDAVFDHSRCFASGWGKDYFGKEGKYQVILKKIELPIVPHYQCQEALRETRLGKYFKLHDSFVCAGGEEGKDTCRGDGGSPLVCPSHEGSDAYVQVGIVAWGIGCGENRVPGVYANVAKFRNWIDHEVLYKDIDTKSYEYQQF